MKQTQREWIEQAVDEAFYEELSDYHDDPL